MGKTLRIILLASLTLGWLLVGPVSARACACGAYITTEQAVVQGETAVIRYLDGIETIDMKMLVGGASRDAAWIMPVPRDTEVSLGDDDQFLTLFHLTRPKRRDVYDFGLLPRMGADGGGAPQAIPTQGAAVSVESVAVIGPFEVTTLSATDPGALNQWLITNGYTERPDLVPTFGRYLDRGWQVLAVKLTPAGGEQLGGDLDALRMTFATDEVVYPIELSSHATVTQDVRLYLVSEGKLEVATEADATNPLEMRFAGRLAMTDIDPTLSGDAEVYVTAYTAQIDPAHIEADYTFARAADDEPYQEYYDRVVWVGYWTWLAIVLIPIAAGLTYIYVRARRRA